MIRLRSIDWFGAGLLLSLPAAAYWLAIAPAVRDNSAAAAMADELLQQHTAAESVERSLNAVKTASHSASTTQPTLTLRPASELNHCLTELNDLAAADALQIDSLAPGDPVARDRYLAIPIAFSAQGSYRSCEHWLSALKTAAPDVSVSQFQIVAGTTDKSGSVRISATLQWYALSAQPKK